MLLERWPPCRLTEHQGICPGDSCRLAATSDGPKKQSKACTQPMRTPIRLAVLRAYLLVELLRSPHGQTSPVKRGSMKRIDRAVWPVLTNVDETEAFGSACP